MDYLVPFISIFSLVFLPLMSIYVMLFSKIFVTLQLILFLIWKLMKGKIRNIYYWVICLSSIFLWFSIFLSRRGIPMSVDLTACSEAGWPLRVFTYPCGAMGGDYVPLLMWKPFYLNYLIWLIISALFVSLLAKNKFLNNSKVKRWLLVIYIIINLSGLGMLLIAFD